ncbi:putative membrane-bound metal-dependent hydrolase (DUF457) [Singulisphaera acidiphila DSM 18658]|uniref:Putative membrane-bound metal-dependent hydrolase (DUF457) n=1 Tax=Singulisphaera acidiphila (strain ATCC BAA-1392 / DSM 18658 / VKM B-2454 / MOB10) TaxID=886293 RepID=L0D948_SINAD|nr:putative membrane-bound metal-dependent hydrolase (DUF457) [Singulisphaera acidiphila DSM 18658]
MWLWGARLCKEAWSPRATPLGNYRQHISFAAALGCLYAWATYVFAGVHWLYGSVAALLATLSGLLPDLDSQTGFGMKGFTGILGVLVALIVWQKMGNFNPEPAFEFHLWAVIAAFVMVRHGLRRVVGRLTVHRGMCHSMPTCAVWGAIAYLYYPTDQHMLRIVMAVAVMTGYFSHLLLDEICSVDLKGARVNKAFGTALKFWAPSPWSTIATYLLLSYLTWRIIQVWPDGPLILTPPTPPKIPITLPENLRIAIPGSEFDR